MQGPRIWLISLLVALVSTSAWAQQQVARLELIPPSPVTNRVMLDIRGAVENNGDSDRQYSLSLFLDRESAATLLHKENVKVHAHSNVGIYCERPCSRDAQSGSTSL
ncbi:MAG: hypothetical protein DMG70_15960 [Acidobacteria bacterium]|nr:MAG: hypothetical protein DMG70_15960 [Acidobacteriota bacterium]